jgi:hypothetical protein
MDENGRQNITATLEKKFDSIFEKLMREIDHDEIIREVELLRTEHPAETREEIAARLARKAALKTATIGATAGVVGGPLALLAMAPDIFTLVREQSRLTLSIAFLYGQKPDLDERSREVLAVLAVATGTTVARSGARTIITKGLESKLAERIFRRIAGEFVIKRLPRIIPVIGGIVGGTVNVLAIAAVERAAIDYYSGLEEELARGDYIDVEVEEQGDGESEVNR